ncbi:hypothetical protein HMI56_001789 [Coelomomyces lativittatus]|nr:hypothetical protein HMI56_001789 [Coelomomyces lativittatus]
MPPIPTGHRFFCHACRSHVILRDPELLICPSCTSDFLELVSPFFPFHCISFLLLSFLINVSKTSSFFFLSFYSKNFERVPLPFFFFFNSIFQGKNLRRNPR